MRYVYLELREELACVLESFAKTSRHEATNVHLYQCVKVLASLMTSCLVFSQIEEKYQIPVSNMVNVYKRSKRG